MKSALVAGLVIATITFALVEIGARVIFAFKVGPQIMLYGTRYCCGPGSTYGPARDAEDQDHTVKYHDNKQGGYSKYFPNQVRVDHNDSGEVFRVTINEQGFRGRNFVRQKPPGTLRVVTLGASSTFGYDNRDHETYPVRLEEELNGRLKQQACGSAATFEVINLGIPHMTSANIVALFEAEGKPLSPDVVTFYEGINDTAIGDGAIRWEKLPLYRRGVIRFKDDLIVFGILDSLLEGKSDRFSARDVAALNEGKAEVFVDNLDEIRQMVSDIGGTFIVANQQAQSRYFSREEIRGVSYEDDAETVRDHLARNNSVTPNGAYFLVHTEIMEAVQAWATMSGVPFVDVIAAMDARRDLLVSWVHVNPEGNRIIARAFADAIFATVCNSPPADGVA